MPKNADADVLLRTIANLPDQFENECEIISLNDIFDIVWYSKFFFDLGEICQTDISDHEDYTIHPRYLSDILALIERKYSRSPNRKLSDFFLSLKAMCEKAQQLNFSLHLEL
ncbi:hypothetical protein [Capsulimonas corticalis]|nr:hypothetical protein [Capsulimonas corticalis]